MWLYRKWVRYTKPETELHNPYSDIYQVGYLQDQWVKGAVMQEFQVVEEYESEAHARREVNFLNGGSPQVEVSGVIYDRP